MNQIAANLRKQIEKNNITVLGLERSAGLKPGSIQNILHGRSKNPNIKTVQSVAKILQCSVEELIDGESLDTIHSHFSKKNIWDQKLYLLSITNIVRFINNEKISVEKNDFLNIVDEVCNYSLENKLETTDERFMKWFILKKCGLLNKNA